MDSYTVTDEGDGLVRVDADIRLVRKPIAVAMCDEVDKVVAGYDGFRILMNMSAMSKGTPAAGVFVLRTMKKYPLEALAFFGANGFMRGMAKTVLGLARFGNFEMFEDEAAARDWLERGGSPSAGPSPTTASRAAGLKRLALPAGLLTSVALVMRFRRRRNRVV
jgi:stage II sporulation SpoAA-like protein